MTASQQASGHSAPGGENTTGQVQGQSALFRPLPLHFDRRDGRRSPTDHRDLCRSSGGRAWSLSPPGPIGPRRCSRGSEPPGGEAGRQDGQPPPQPPGTDVPLQDEVVLVRCPMQGRWGQGGRAHPGCPGRGSSAGTGGAPASSSASPPPTATPTGAPCRRSTSTSAPPATWTG